MNYLTNYGATGLSRGGFKIMTIFTFNCSRIAYIGSQRNFFYHLPPYKHCCCCSGLVSVLEIAQPDLIACPVLPWRLLPLQVIEGESKFNVFYIGIGLYSGHVKVYLSALFTRLVTTTSTEYWEAHHCYQRHNWLLMDSSSPKFFQLCLCS